MSSASFSLPREQIDWLQSVAHRRSVSVSQLVREILSDAMDASDASANGRSWARRPTVRDADEWLADGDDRDSSHGPRVRLPRSLRREANGAIPRRDEFVELMPPAGLPLSEDYVVS